MMSPHKRSDQCRSCMDCNTRSPLFKYLTEDELALVNGSRYELFFREGETIIKQGTDTTHIITLTSGLAKIYIEGYQGRNLILKIARPGEMFGGPGFFTDGRNHYSVAAIEDATCCYLDGKIFQTLVETNIKTANELIRKINRSAIHNFEKLVNLTQKQVPGRMADTLLYLQKEVYLENPFTLTLSRQDLADMTGLSKESVIRILKEFKEDQILEMKGDYVEILNFEMLNRIAQAG